MRFIVVDEFSREELAGFPSELEAKAYADAANRFSSRCVAVRSQEDWCTCGKARREITTPGDECFFPRTGCLNCNVWDTKLMLRSRRTTR